MNQIRIETEPNISAGMSEYEGAPLVSIGLPVYNGEKYLALAVESVLNQTFDNFRLIISDNASTDSTQKICERYAMHHNRIKFYRNPKNIGILKNFKSVFDLSDSKYFMWMSHDDILEPTYLEKCVQFLQDNDDFVLCSTKNYLIGHDAQEHGVTQGDFTLDSDSPVTRYRKLLANIWLPVQVYGVIRSEALKNVQALNGLYPSDWMISSELCWEGKFFEFPTPLRCYRKVNPNYSAIQLSQRRPFELSHTPGQRWLFPHLFFIPCIFAAILGKEFPTHTKARLYWHTIRRGHVHSLLYADIKHILRSFVYLNPRITTFLIALRNRVLQRSD
jgi:glycosyltransferase involved in cell wall biosynthesis